MSEGTEALIPIIQALEGRVGELEQTLIGTQEQLAGISETVEEVVAKLQDLSEMAAAPKGRRMTGRKGKPGAVPAFRYWSGKKRGIPLTPFHRLVRFRKSPTQWLRFGIITSLQQMAAPTMLITGMSMLITILWQLSRHIAMVERQVKEEREYREAQEEELAERKAIVDELIRKYGRDDIRGKHRSTIA